MRFDELVLSRYGHFTDFRLDFGTRPETGPDLHVLYGPNEAGKSTTLAAITDMLYGIERTTPWKFLHGNELLELQATLTQAGQSLSLKRLKRHWTNAHDERLERFPFDLQGLSREDYQRRFSFDEQTLQAGGEQILSSAGDVGQALFSASAGLSDLKQRLDQAMDSANRFWIPGRRKNMRLFELKEALAENKRQMDAVKLDTPAWKKRRLHLDHVTLRRDSHRQKRDQLQSELKQLERRESARSLAESVHSLAMQLAAVGQETIIAPDHPMASDFATANMAQQILERTRDQLGECRRARDSEAEYQTRQQELEQRLQACEPDDRSRQWLQAAPRIHSLIEEGGAVHEWQKQLADNRTLVEQCQKEIQALCQRLALPIDTPPDALLPGEHQREEWQSLLDEQQTLAADERHARLELERLIGNLEQGTEKADDSGTEQMPSAAAARSPAELDIDIALALVHRLQQDGVYRQQVQTRDAWLQTRQAVELTLQPLSLTPEQFAQIDVPERGWLDARLDMLGSTDGQIDQLQQQRKDRDQRLIENRARCEALAEAGAIDPDQLAQARQQRDEAWQAHRAGITQAAASQALLASAVEFEQAMQALDELQRRHAGNVDAGSELTMLRREQRSLQDQLQALDEQIDDCLQDRSRQTAAILERVQTFYAGSTIDAEQLRERHARLIKAREQQAQLDELSLKRQSLSSQADEQQASLLTMLRPILTSGEEQALVALSLSDLLSESLRLIEVHRSALAQAREREREHEEQRRQQLARQSQLQAARDQLSGWQTRWQHSTRDSLLAERTPAQARDALTLLATLAPQVEQCRAAERKVQTLSEQLSGHESRLAELLEELAVTSLADAAAEVEAARTRGERHRQLLSEITAVQKKREDTATQYAHSLRSVETLCRDLGVTAESGLLDLLKHTVAHRELLERHADAVQQLHRVSGEALDEAGIEALSQSGAAEEIAQQLTRVRDELDEVTRELEMAEQEVTLARRELEELGDDSQFAWLNQQRENLLLQMADEARQCAVARTGQKVLDAAMRRFRSEHQSVILDEARQAFATLTGGRYQQLLPREDDKGNEQLYVVDARGTPRAVTALSTGTRYQLYLALRAAAYADYAAQRPPLPFVADDIMESFDDERSAAAFRVLAGMARHGQVIYLTHHRHLLDLVRDVVGPDHVHIHHYQ